MSYIYGLGQNINDQSSNSDDHLYELGMQEYHQDLRPSDSVDQHSIDNSAYDRFNRHKEASDYFTRPDLEENINPEDLIHIRLWYPCRRD